MSSIIILSALLFLIKTEHITVADGIISEEFDSFTKQAKYTLFEKAKNSLVLNHDSSFNSDNKALSSTLFIYSDVSNIDDKKDPFYSIKILENFENIVSLRPDQMSYTSKKIMDHVKSSSNIFAYINLGPNNPYSPKSEWFQSDLTKLKSEIDDISNAGWHGVFIDQFGYDWGETRERQNIIIDYAHDKDLSVMVNAWHPEDALARDINKISNPNGITSHLNSNDWILIESFYVDASSYRSDSSYIEKYLKTKEYSEKAGVKIAALSYKKNSDSWEQAKKDIDNSYILAYVLGFDSWFFAKYDNSNKFTYGKRTDIDLGDVIQPLKFESNNKYLAETDNYIVEFYADKNPQLKLIEKQSDYNKYRIVLIFFLLALLILILALWIIPLVN